MTTDTPTTVDAEDMPTDIDDSLRLGEDTRTLRLNGLDDNRAYAGALCTQAQRGVYIASRLLDPPILNTMEVWNGLRACISAHARFQVRVLVMEPSTLARDGHVLLRLSHEFSSFVDIRTPAETYKGYDAFLLLADEVGVLHRPVAARWHGIVSFNDPARARQLGHEFNKMWETASKDINLARMRL